MSSSHAAVDPARAKESHLAQILGVETTLHAIAFTVTALRLYVRFFIIKSHGRDDWTVAASTLCATTGWALYVYQAFHGLGHHQDTVSDSDLTSFNAATFWQVIITSSAGIALLKTSIALNLLRLSPSRWYSWTLWASIAFVNAYSFMAWMTFFLYCKPMKGYWDSTVQAKCYPIHLFITFALINTSFNIFTDILMAVLPVPIIWRLQMKRKTRLYLIGILNLGFIAVGIGIVKAVYQIGFSDSEDGTFNDWILFWAGVQINVGIIAASVPSLKPLVSKVLKLSEYSNSYGTGARYGYGDSTRRTRRGGMNTGVGGSRHARNPEMYALEELESNEGDRNSDKFSNNKSNYNATVAAGSFYKGAGSEGERSGSEERILHEQAAHHGNPKGIVMTTEIVVK